MLGSHWGRRPHSLHLRFVCCWGDQGCYTCNERRQCCVDINSNSLGLFMVQRFGTDKVGYSFAPIIWFWFTLIGGIGVFNFIKYDPTVLKAINPMYIIDYFTRNKKEAWISFGGVVLAITGTEAMFADVGHFTVRSIQISMCSLTYPALILAYTGQASFLRKNSNLVSETFYKSIPGPMY
ncbi:hypothetical protein K1719_035260 [Acacia pycnantha]|nr:hypothetical protein K1719_035260 [Acacia pycnantha]